MEQMTEEKIARINELYRKQKSVGLTFEENVAAVRRNLRSQLNRIDMVNEDGSVENLGEKYDGKRPN